MYANFAGADDYCKIRGNHTISAQPAVQMDRVVYVEPFNERAVMEAVAMKGPLSIGIDASCIPFRFYSEGILNTTECGNQLKNIDHAVLLVGYGQEDGALLLSSRFLCGRMCRRSPTQCRMLWCWSLVHLALGWPSWLCQGVKYRACAVGLYNFCQ
jgi:hypothetical protein